MIITKLLEVTNQNGMHLRPAGILSEMTNINKYTDLGVFLMHNGMRVDAKSVFNIVALGASCGSKIILEIEYETEENTLLAEGLASQVEDFFANGFETAEVKE